MSGKSLEHDNIIGVFSCEEMLLDAMKEIKKKSLKIKNVFTPYPVNEVIHEMGLTTRMPYFAFGFGTLGTLSIFTFLYYSSVIDYPIIIGGKPSLTLSFIIILFVMTINVGIVLSLLSFFTIQKLYPGKKAEVVHDEITDDKFVIVIEGHADMTKHEEEKIKGMLVKHGAIETGRKKNIENI